MRPFTTHSGLVLPFDRVNVDTDQMVPKQFLKALTREGFGRTHLVSPVMAAAAAIAGHPVDVREFDVAHVE